MSIFTADIKYEPYWWGASPRLEWASAEWPERVDVAIVGGGYAGLNAAIPLAEAGLRVAVIEAERFGEGASTRNGGAIGATLRYSFAALIERAGLERAIHLYSGAIASRKFLIDLLETRGIDCQFVRCGRFSGAHKQADYDGLARDLELRQHHLDVDARMVPRSEQRAYIGTDQYFGGRVHNEDGNLNPGLYHDGLMAAAAKAGVMLLDRARVTQVRQAGGAFKVATSRGDMRADRVIVATNAYTGPEFGWFRRRLVPIQSQIIATEPLPPDLVRSLIPRGHQVVDTCKLHNYYRLSPDGTRVLFGGRSGASQVNNFAKSGQSLFRRMTGLFPQLAGAKVTHSWGGFIAFSFDHLPHMTEADGIHYIGSCCGSGVAMMSYLGHSTALKLLGQTYDATFETPFKRQLFYSGDPWFMPAIIGVLELRDRYRI